MQRNSAEHTSVKIQAKDVAKNSQKTVYKSKQTLNEVQSLQRASVGYNKKYLTLKSDHVWHKLVGTKTVDIQSDWMGRTHQPFLCNVGLQWNIPNILNTVAKICHITSFEDTIYILMNVCIDYLICVYVWVRKRIGQGEKHSMR